MKKLLVLLPLLFSVVGLASCSSESYTPDKGGKVDTLHNEIHVSDYATLIAGGFEHEKDEFKSKNSFRL